MAKKATATEIDPNERLDQLATEIEASESELIEIEATIWNSETPTADLIRKHQAIRAGIVDLYRAAGRLSNDLVASTQAEIDRLEAALVAAEADREDAIVRAETIITDAGMGISSYRIANGEKYVGSSFQRDSPTWGAVQLRRAATDHPTVVPFHEGVEVARNSLYAAKAEQNRHTQNRETIRQRIGVEWAASIGGRR